MRGRVDAMWQWSGLVRRARCWQDVVPCIVETHDCPSGCWFMHGSTLVRMATASRRDRVVCNVPPHSGAAPLARSGSALVNLTLGRPGAPRPSPPNNTSPSSLSTFVHHLNAFLLVSHFLCLSHTSSVQPQDAASFFAPSLDPDAD